jgi:hypothetical protein
VVAGLLVRPDLLAGLDALAQDPEPLRGVGAVVSHLLEVPARPDAEQQASAGEPVERGDGLRGGDRVPLDQQADRVADPDALGGVGHGGQGDERVVDPRVLARQLAARGVGRLAARGDVGVLGDEDGLEAALLGHPGERRRLDRLVGGEVGDAEVHPRDPFRALASTAWKI